MKYDFPRHVRASPEVRDLLSRVFVLPQKAARIDLAGMAAHPWVTNNGVLPTVSSDGSPAGDQTQVQHGWCGLQTARSVPSTLEETSAQPTWPARPPTPRVTGSGIVAASASRQ